MSKKEMTVHIGGEDRLLSLSKMGFLRCLQEFTGEDPYTFGSKELTFESTYNFIAGLIYAGLMGKHTKDEVREWVDNLDADEAAKIVSDYVEAVKTDKPGEDQAPKEQE